MSPLPLPVRIAAGLVATAVEQVRELPRLVVEFPVTAVSQALQASMRVQQRVTDLAIKGDRALGALRPVEDKPSWATFDDDEQPRRNGASTVTELRPQARPEPRATTRIPVAMPPEPEPAEPAEPAEQVAAAQAIASDTVDAETSAAPAGPNLMPGYGDMTIPQLRARLRTLTVEDLQALLAWETAHENRPPYVTMLSNRITTVTAD